MDFERFSDDDLDHPTAAWPWAGRLPDGVVILEGRGGLGKSTLTADLAARVSKGTNWPDGAKGVKGGVLLFGHEDRKGIVHRRLKDAGADTSKILRITKASIDAESDELERAIVKHKVRLVVLDPAVDFLGVDTRHEESVRHILEKLDGLCEKHGVCMILIRHMRKDANDQDPMEDGGRGTGALRNWVRGVYRLILDPDDDKRRLLMATKFNYGEFPETLVFQNSDSRGVNRLAWDDKPSRWNAFNLISRPKEEVQRYQGRECDTWLKDYMYRNHYRVRAKDALKAGREYGFTTRTLQRTRVKLNIRLERLPVFQGDYLWTHPLYDPDEDPGPPADWIPPDHDDGTPVDL